MEWHDGHSLNRKGVSGAETLPLAGAVRFLERRSFPVNDSEGGVRGRGRVELSEGTRDVPTCFKRKEQAWAASKDAAGACRLRYPAEAPSIRK